MQTIFIQVIVLLAILALIYFNFKNDQEKIKIKDMSIVAILCVLTAVLSKTLSIKLPPGQPIFVIGFATTIAILIGILFSPKLAIIAGIITDLIGILIAPATGDVSMPFLGFTLSAILACYLPSILVKYTKNRSAATINVLIIGILFVFILLTNFYIFSVDKIKLDQNAIILTDEIRYGIIALLSVIALIIVVINYLLGKRFSTIDTNLAITSAHLTLIILVVEIVCHIILTSFWISTLYEVPFFIASSTRIIKAVLVLPIYLIILYFILKYIPTSLKTRILKKESV